MNKLLDLRLKHKSPPLSSFITDHNPIFANMKRWMRKRDYIIPLVYNEYSGNICYGRSMYTESYIKTPLHWYFDEPRDLKFISENLSRHADPISEMKYYSSTRIYH